MPVVVSVVGASVVALVVVLVAQWAGKPAVMGDPAPAERWFVERVRVIPGARRLIDGLDRYVWGGSMVALAFGAVLGAAALVGWILSTVDDDRGFARFDRAVAQWGSDHATRYSTETLTWITHLGDTLLLLVAMTVVALVVLVRGNGHGWAVLGFLLTVGLGVSLINNALKWAVSRDRPEVDLGPISRHRPRSTSSSAAAGPRSRPGTPPPQRPAGRRSRSWCRAGCGSTTGAGSRRPPSRSRCWSPRAA